MVQGLGSNGTGRNVKDAGQLLSGDLVHVGDHQQKTLGSGKGGGDGTGTERTVDSACGAGLGLHLNNLDLVAEDVLQACSAPLVNGCRPWGWRGVMGVDRRHLGVGIGTWPAAALASILLKGRLSLILPRLLSGPPGLWSGDRHTPAWPGPGNHPVGANIGTDVTVLAGGRVNDRPAVLQVDQAVRAVVGAVPAADTAHPAQGFPGFRIVLGGTGDHLGPFIGHNDRQFLGADVDAGGAATHLSGSTLAVPWTISRASNRQAWTQSPNPAQP